MAVIEYIDGPTDIKKELVTNLLARKFAETQKLSVQEVIEKEEKVKELGLPKSIIRDLKKIQFSNSLEQIDLAVEKKMADL